MTVCHHVKALTYTHCHCVRVLFLVLCSLLPTWLIRAGVPATTLVTVEKPWCSEKWVRCGSTGLFRNWRRSWEEIPQENHILRQDWLAYHLAPRTQISSQTLPEWFLFHVVSWNFKMRESLCLTIHGNHSSMGKTFKSVSLPQIPALPPSKYVTL